MSSVGFQEQRLDAHRSSDGFKRAIEHCQGMNLSRLLKTVKGQSSVSRIVFEEKQLGVMNFSERVLDRHGIHNWMEGPSPRYSDTTCELDETVGDWGDKLIESVLHDVVIANDFEDAIDGMTKETNGYGDRTACTHGMLRSGIDGLFRRGWRGRASCARHESLRRWRLIFPARFAYAFSGKLGLPERELFTVGALSEVDILIMPTTPWVAKVMPPPDASPLTHFSEARGLPFDHTGHPALSIPCGVLSPPEGPETLKLPVGMQLVSKHHHELPLYRAGLAWSEAFD
ncbi:hypothetical protein BU17DRAFT_79689 [Hysterangium stoloniferum]|nr:hypothetical protein BU17DRAFT_79689 [Hysterangium stoloniferum]